MFSHRVACRKKVRHLTVRRRWNERERGGNMIDSHSSLQNELSKYLASLTGVEPGLVIGHRSPFTAVPLGTLVALVSDDVDLTLVSATCAIGSALCGNETLFIPLRGVQDAVSRLIEVDTGISADRVSDNAASRGEALDSAGRISSLGSLGIWSSDLPSTSLIWERIEREISDRALVIIDSVELIDPPGPDGIASTIRALRGFVADGDIAVIATLNCSVNDSQFALSAATTVLGLSAGGCKGGPSGAISINVERSERGVLGKAVVRDISPGFIEKDDINH